MDYFAKRYQTTQRHFGSVEKRLTPLWVRIPGTGVSIVGIYVYDT